MSPQKPQAITTKFLAYIYMIKVDIETALFNECPVCTRMNFFIIPYLENVIL